MTLQEKEENKENDQVAKQEWLLEDFSPVPKQRPEQDGGNESGEVIQQEEQQGGKK